MFGQDGRPLNRPARRALVAMDQRFRKNKARRGDEFAARRLAEQAEQLKARAIVLGASRPTLTGVWRAARQTPVTDDDVESLPATAEDSTAPDAPVKALAPGDVVVEEPAPIPGRVKARGLRALAPADAAEA